MIKYKTMEELRSAYVRRDITQKEFIEKSSEMNMIRIPFNRLKKNNHQLNYQKKYQKC